jgi:hypothetical protein
MNMLDPNKIRFSNKNVTVVDLLALVPASLDVPVTEAELTAMVGLALVNGPLPAVALCMSVDGSVTRVGVGARLVSALRAFANGARLGTSMWDESHSGGVYSELMPWLRRRFNHRDVAVCLIEPGTPGTVAEAVLDTLALG